MKKLILTAIAALLLLPMLATAAGQGQVTVNKGWYFPLNTLMGGANTAHYVVTVENTGSIPFIGNLQITFSGKRTECTQAGTYPDIPGDSSQVWKIMSTYGTYDIPGGQAVTSITALTDTEFNPGDPSIGVTVDITSPSGITTGSEYTMTAVFWDSSTMQPISVACEDIKIVTPQGLVSITLIEITLMAAGSILMGLGVLGFFI